MSANDALEIMRRDIGRAFDPTVFEVFEGVIAERDPAHASDAADTIMASSAPVRRPSRDDLTELPLRRACTAASSRLLAARRHDGTAASLLYVEVAGLDVTKQTLGQARADDVLAMVASVLRRASRRGDVLARFGADDFVLLLGDASAEHALTVAGRVRSQLGDGLDVNGVAPIAIGVATAPEHGENLDALVAAARRAVDSQPERARNALAVADGIAEPRRPRLERFVGRVPELRRLEHLLDSAVRSNARVVTLSGPTGTGKTSLVSRLLLDARRRGATHVVGTCRASAFQIPYAPWIDIIEGLRAARVIPDRRWHSLPTLVPSLTASQRAPRLARDGNAQADASIPAEICELLTMTAAARPLVIVIDDAEHADQASWDVIDRLARGLTDERLLVCLTVDEASAKAARSRLAGCSRHSEIRLSGLAPEDVRSWIGDLFPDAATADTCAVPLAAAGGVTPLWGVHALHALVDGGHLAYADGAWRAARSSLGRALDVPPPPPSLPAVLARRIASLTPKTRAIVGELALLGDVFEVDVALAAGIGDEAELLDAVDEALAAALLRDEGADPGAAFAFTHSAVAAAARLAVDPSRLSRVHERIARGLEQARPVALFEIAEHFDRAGIGDRAFEYALLAAARAVSVHAYADAAIAYGRARAHATSPAQSSRLDELQGRLPVR